MTFDRSAFRGSPSSRRKKQVEKHEEKVNKKSSGSNDFAELIKLQEGSNYVRVLPIHPKTIKNLGEDESSNMYPKTTHFLETDIKYTKNGEEIEERKRIPHLCSKTHGGTKKSLLDEYVSYAFKMAAEETQDDKEFKAFMSPILNFNTGIKQGTKWVAYVKVYSDKNKDDFKHGMMFLPVSVANAMNELSETDDEDEADIFSDPDEGFTMVVTKDKKAGAKDPKKYYKVAAHNIQKGPKAFDVLTDEDLIWLSKQKPLDEMYLNIYKKEDFYKSLEALKQFDESVDFGIFASEDFLDTVEEISKYYEDGEVDREDDVFASNKSEEEKEEVDKKRQEKEDDSDLPFDKDLSDMNIKEMKGYIKRNKLNIKVLARYTADDLFDIIRDEESIREEEEKELKPEPRGRRRLSEFEDVEEED